jgi:NAD(P)-dependent dehydrogenase (short-subunit alcohol dehydrogenase family)
VRSRARGEAARERIRELTGSDTTHLVVADLSLQTEVRRAAAELRAAFPSLQVLVNNAAIYAGRRHLTAEGVELQWAVNHLAPFLLTRLLLPALTAGAPARVITLSSNAHHSARWRWDDLEMAQGRYRGFTQYANTKLANVLFTRELARRTLGTGVSAWAVHPGVVGTQLLTRGFPPIRLVRRWLRTPEQGAATVVHLATCADPAAPSGSYFRDELPIEVSALARDPGAAPRLWELSEARVGGGG